MTCLTSAVSLPHEPLKGFRFANYTCLHIPGILNNDPSLDVETVFKRTELGRQIVSQKIVDALDAEGHRPYGKLLTWKHEQEVSEHDGQDGRGMWCVVGNFVYDITG